MKRFTLSMAAIMLVFVLVLTGCGSSNKAADAGGSSNAQAASGDAEKKEADDQATEAAAKPSGEKVKVNIAINGGLNPLIIAQEKGWLDEAFGKLNAEIAWSKFTSGPPLLESLVAGRVDLSFLGDGAAITGVSNKLPFRVVGLITEGERLNSVLVPADSAIAKVEDLKGKTVGLAKGTTSHVYLIKVLTAHGLKQEDVKLINLQFDDAQAAFEAGKLDAWVSIDPYVTMNVAQKKAKALDAGIAVQAPVSMIAHTEFAKDHPEIIVEYLKQYKQALDWQYANLDEAVAIYEKLTKIPAPILKQVLENSQTGLSAYTQKALDAQQASADILLENKFLKQPTTFKDAVDDSFVNEALK
ncbi:aliphatic sulfonate ABC transporter substrate-binding protein [Paenibacillus aurantiacus]|uniref:Aliphatic sulfonate ABC transporter substrate-binding protein n=1 Tax=Paenibacillus aurantiacus TaxID=1936118 RepID=A0ABV5KNW2_9BACL